MLLDPYIHIHVLTIFCPYLCVGSVEKVFVLNGGMMSHTRAQLVQLVGAGMRKALVNFMPLISIVTAQLATLTACDQCSNGGRNDMLQHQRLMSTHLVQQSKGLSHFEYLTAHCQNYRASLAIFLSGWGILPKEWVLITFYALDIHEQPFELRVLGMCREAFQLLGSANPVFDVYDMNFRTLAFRNDWVMGKSVY